MLLLQRVNDVHGFKAWLDDRTGYRDIVHWLLAENVPGGARWRYVWGSTLVFTFAVQVITGLALWVAYSPSAQTAWESVYYIQYQMNFGWLLRGIHHYSAQAMIVLLIVHLLQVVVDGAYRAPREVNFWLGLVLLHLVLGLALTGYLLPWDQKGYWATKVATKIAGLVPLVGPLIQRVVVGGSDYGHHTLTRFFALHAGLLPGLVAVVLVAHVALFRRHGITARTTGGRPDAPFWPEQVLKDGVACLVVLGIVMALAVGLGAELGAPADPANNYNAARPEWYFLFLFQFLKLFHGETEEVIGAIIVPAGVMLLLALMPLVGRWRWGHRANVTLLLVLLAATAGLAGQAWYEDYHARWTAASAYADVEKVLEEIAVDLRREKSASKYHGKTESEQVAAYFNDQAATIQPFLARLAGYRRYQQSRAHIEAVHAAEVQAERARQLAGRGIPPAGNLTQMRADPKTQGPRLFRRYCASCHDHVDPSGLGIRIPRPLQFAADGQTPVPNGAANLYRFASRPWLQGLLDPDRIAAVTHDAKTMRVTGAPYFGNTAHRDGEMVESFVQSDLVDLDDDEKAEIAAAVIALSAEAGLRYQKEEDQQARQDGSLAKGRATIADRCTECHKFGDEGELGEGPELTGYGSRAWLIDFISNPAHQRFYGENNDRMPAFAAYPAVPDRNLLDRAAIEQLADWLREDWPLPAPAGTQP